MQFELLQNCPAIGHSVFSRQGGVSSGIYTSLNLCYRTGDNPGLVGQNLEVVRAALDAQKVTAAYQVHGNRIIKIDCQPEFEIPTCDGLITSVPGIALLIRHADCQAAIFYDPRKHVIGCIHAGWRGQVQGIYSNAVAAMSYHYSSRPEDILVGISPSLGPSHAEFANFREELPSNFWKYQVSEGYFNLWEAARDELVMAGILRHHIEVAGICTYDSYREYFSYRRDKVTGRNGTAVILR
ncbi:MAG: peptidoglycan editing factor PgeF [Chlamydiota bacterium]